MKSTQSVRLVKDRLRLFLGHSIHFLAFKTDKRHRGLDALLGHLLVKRIPVMCNLSSTKVPEYLSQK